jgi:electron transport complex protein RnfE
MSYKKTLLKGIWTENPVFRVMLGLCPALATSTSVNNAIGMGAAVIFVLLCSNILISVIRSWVPDKIRIPIYICVIAAFVTIVDLMMAAYLPALSKSLGIFIPLIVVNCIILGRAEAFAGKNGIFLSILDALGMGFGYSLSLIIIASIRETLGNGTWMGSSLFGGSFEPVLIMILPAGAFFTIGLLIGLANWFEHYRKTHHS